MRWNHIFGMSLVQFWSWDIFTHISIEKVRQHNWHQKKNNTDENISYFVQGVGSKWQNKLCAFLLWMKVDEGWRHMPSLGSFKQPAVANGKGKAMVLAQRLSQEGNWGRQLQQQTHHRRVLLPLGWRLDKPCELALPRPWKGRKGSGLGQQNRVKKKDGLCNDCVLQMISWSSVHIYVPVSKILLKWDSHYKWLDCFLLYCTWIAFLLLYRLSCQRPICT